MLAQVVLTPAESKKLIALSILALPEVENARQNGILAIHPSTSTWFLFEALLGKAPLPRGVIACGITAPQGLTYTAEVRAHSKTRGPGPHEALDSSNAWFIKRGVLQPQTRLGDILDEMTEQDVYIKGCNAVDSQGNVGVLFGHPLGGGGTIGKVMIARRAKPFHLILPVGLEKTIPVPIAEAAKKAGFHSVEKYKGLMRCGLIPVSGKKVDERDAFASLTGAAATPIAAGGLAGAEGAIVMTLEGTEQQIAAAWALYEQVKGAAHPEIRVADE